jgi:hypothetical protein
MALPREAAKVSHFNRLQKGLGGNRVIELQGISVRLPKPFLLNAEDTDSNLVGADETNLAQNWLLTWELLSAEYPLNRFAARSPSHNFELHAARHTAGPSDARLLLTRGAAR